ncbi:MAG: hypothetical protein HZA51_14140 [Planctomycetes bacterium]|nr:hypothetical protein [Planctomycetota bacterium]
MPKRRTACLAVVLLFASKNTALASLFTVDQWSVGVGTRGEFPYFDGDSSNIVSNPFVESFQAMDRASSATASFDFSWNDSSGDFLIDGSLRCVAQNLPPYPGAIGSELCAASAGIYFTTTADLLMSVDAAFDYNLAGPNLFAFIDFNVYPVTTNKPVDPIFASSMHDDTYTHYPAAGTLRITGQAIVPAGQTYLFSLSQILIADRNTGAIAMGDGYYHFTLQTIPEPATSALLILATLLFSRSQRYRCR